MEFRSAGRSWSHDLLPPVDDTQFPAAGRMIQPEVPLERPVSTSGPIRETTVRVESRCRQDSAGELRVRSRLAPAGSCQFGCGTTFSVVAGC